MAPFPESDITQNRAASAVSELNGGPLSEEPPPCTTAWSSGEDKAAPEAEPFEPAAEPEQTALEIPQYADDDEIEMDGLSQLPAPVTEPEVPAEKSLPDRTLASPPATIAPVMDPLVSNQLQEPSVSVAAALHELPTTTLLVPATQNGSAETAEPGIADDVHTAALVSALASAKTAPGPALEVEEPQSVGPNGSESHARSVSALTGTDPATSRSFEAPRPAGHYRPRLDRSARVDDAAPPPRAEAKAEGAGPLSLDAELQLTFSPGGWGISFAILFRRRAEIPEEITVRTGADSYELAAIADDLFEPVATSKPEVLLATGVAAESATSPAARWVRTGRALHVFTARAGVAGFVSIPRVLMGQENALLCTDQLALKVIEACAAAGSAQPKEVEGPGVPAGWRCFRGIRPTVPKPPADCDALLMALVPLPHAVIDFAGGLQIDRLVWLCGNPPSIKILGDLASLGDVTIDGQAALSNEMGEWTAPGWDSEGRHTVAYKGLTRGYEIGPGLDSWDVWKAHTSNA